MVWFSFSIDFSSLESRRFPVSRAYSWLMGSNNCILSWANKDISFYCTVWLPSLWVTRELFVLESYCFFLCLQKAASLYSGMALHVQEWLFMLQELHVLNFLQSGYNAFRFWFLSSWSFLKSIAPSFVSNHFRPHIVGDQKPWSTASKVANLTVRVYYTKGCSLESVLGWATQCKFQQRLGLEVPIILIFSQWSHRLVYSINNVWPFALMNEIFWKWLLSYPYCLESIG